MKTATSSQKSFTIPHYEENGALQLVALTGMTYIMFHFARVLFLVFGHDKHEVFNMMFPNIGLSSIELFKHKVWTIFTYGLAHHSFGDWITNMIWAYAFAAILQSIAGFKQVIPLFFYGLLAGALCYFIAQFLMPATFTPQQDHYILGAYGGITAIGFAALILNARHRLYFSDTFSIPLYLILSVYILITGVAYFTATKEILALSSGGALMGIGFAYLLKKGYQPATWIYDVLESIQKTLTPKENEARNKRELAKRKELLQTFYTPTADITQERLDEILDKINAKGFYSLTKEERETLKKASNE
jgi:membrane associated rhomboid family serine protease